MNIIYFTTAQEKSDYSKYISLWKHPINPSNQVFHNKLIRALGNINHVDVISFRPFSKKECQVKKLIKEERPTSQIDWHYLEVKNNKALRISLFYSQARQIVNKLPKDSLIICDTINPTVLKIAVSCSRKYKLPIIGICTDSPSNISGTTRQYTMSILKQAKNLDGYIALTTGLDELFNEQHKNSLILEGIVENNIPTKSDSRYGKYFFMGGALSERYGVYDLIEAFKTYNPRNINLVICGHHGNEEKLKEAIAGDERIFYLGTIENDEVINLEINSICNINPRPYNEDLDRYSIPSKVLEYLNSNVPVISVKNSKLYKVFSNDIIWAKSSSKEDLIEAFMKLDSLKSPDKKILAENAKKDVNHYFSIDATSEKLKGFLYLFSKR